MSPFKGFVINEADKGFALIFALFSKITIKLNDMPT